MGDSDWPMQNGELTHRVPPGWIETINVQDQNTRIMGRGCPSQKNANGAGNISRPDMFCLLPA